MTVLKPPRCVRAFAAGHRRGHLVPIGEKAALCGAKPREGRQWLTHGSKARALADLKPCQECATRQRFLEDVAAWDGPAPKAGVVAVVRIGASGRASAAECARCGRLRALVGRGLCHGCVNATRADGTVGDYGWTRMDRMDEFAGYRAAGLTISAASVKAGVSQRTGARYENALAGAGRAPWRAAS